MMQYEDRSSEEYYANVTVLETSLVPAHAWNEKNSWGWTSTSLDETYETGVRYDVAGGGVLLYSRDEAVYYQAKGQLNRTVKAHLARVNKYCFAPWRKPEYKYALLDLS